MRNVSWLAAAGLLVSAAGCTSYPGNGYGGGYPSGGYGQPAYYGGQQGYSNSGGLLGGLFNQQTYQPAPTYYQQPQTYYQPQARYVPVPQQQIVSQPRYASTPTPVQSRRSAWGSRDSDGDGIPNRYDRDRNNDGLPDRQQRRGPTG